MEYVIVYLAIGVLLAWAYRSYFRNDPTSTLLGKRETEILIAILWLPVLAIVAICAFAAAVVDFCKRKK